MIRNKPIIVGIAGGSASGKSTFTQKLHARLGARATLLQQDSYYHDLERQPGYDPKRGKTGIDFDDPVAIDHKLLALHLSKLAAGRTVQTPRYDYVSARRVGHDPVRPSPVIIVEGLFVLHFAQVRQYLDHAIYFRASQQTRERRRLARDVERKGDAPEHILDYLKRFVFPAHNTYIGPSQIFANITFENERDDTESLERWAAEQALVISALSSSN